ncbi:MAG: hypothetical protein GXO88_05590 [Chlorobi bacterium]|nr:hypothetical protein [Chlorobiota bacterium]
MINTEINIETIKTIANALGNLNDKVVYVGGSVVSLYIDDPAAEEVRPTADIDFFLEIASLSKLEELRVELRNKGFIQLTDNKVICRFSYKDVDVDVMATKEIGWAPSNKWFSPGIKSSEKIKLDNCYINILSLPYFLASKFEAFTNRGGIDPRTSTDFEDITYILNNNIELVDKLNSSNTKVKEFLINQFEEILKNNSLQEAILGNLFFEDQNQHFEMIINKLNNFIKFNSKS